MNTLASDTIHSYIQDGYRIDAKESVIDRDKDKDCTFKAVLKKDVDGIECKTVITLTDNGDDKNKACMYHKVETVGDTKWSEETRTYSCSKNDANVVSQLADRDDRKVCGDDEDSDNITKDDDNDWLARHRKFRKCFKLISDPDTHKFRWVFLDDQKTSTDNKSDVDKKDTRWKCKCPSAYKRLDDYIKVNDSDDDSKQVSEQDSDNKDNHIKVEPHDSVDDVYNKIVNRRKNLKESCEAKARSDKQEDNLPKQDLDDDDLEDSLVKLVHYIFGK
jgi:hypothetical protein